MKPTWKRLLPDTAALDSETLLLGGCDVRALADQFGTPLYVYDLATLQHQARRARNAFGPLRARISFAAKACSTLAVLRVFEEEGLNLDAVSAGELEAGLRSGFVPDRMHLHGNFKSDEELEQGIQIGLHALVVDNREELERLDRLAAAAGRTARVLLRLALPVEAQTHPYLRTSGARSKFGFDCRSADLRAALDRLRAGNRLQLVGMHTHLGSQITDPDIYSRAALELVTLSRSLLVQGFPLEEVSIGGGWAVAYGPEESELAPERVAEAIAPVFADAAHIQPAVEPGRALVARAAMSVYRVGSIKQYHGRRIVAVDGGMGDNPRPALYGARYAPFLVGRIGDEPIGPADIVGRFCESGDVLARDVSLPQLSVGELLCIPVAGAYQLSMASGYNLVPQPAAVMVDRGASRLITRRATVDDLLAREVNEATILPVPSGSRGSEAKRSPP